MIEVLSMSNCSWCIRVEGFLNARGLDYEKWQPDLPDLRAFMIKQGFKTVPQVFHNGKHVGGYTETVAYYEQGGFDTADQGDVSALRVFPQVAK
jgi:glutaredoxin 3